MSSFTWAYLATMAGAAVGTSVIVQFVKGKGILAKLDTQLLSYIIAFLVLETATYFSSGLTVATALLAAMNAFIVALTSNGAYDAIKSASNSVITAKTIQALSISVSGVTSFLATNIATDSRANNLIITSISSFPDASIAVASLTNGSVSITGVSIGTASIIVTVGNGNSTLDVTVPISIVSTSPIVSSAPNGSTV